MRPALAAGRRRPCDRRRSSGRRGLPDRLRPCHEHGPRGLQLRPSGRRGPFDRRTSRRRRRPWDRRARYGICAGHGAGACEMGAATSASMAWHGHAASAEHSTSCCVGGDMCRNETTRPLGMRSGNCHTRITCGRTRHAWADCGPKSSRPRPTVPGLGHAKTNMTRIRALLDTTQFEPISAPLPTQIPMACTSDVASIVVLRKSAGQLPRSPGALPWPSSQTSRGRIGREFGQLLSTPPIRADIGGDLHV